MIGSQDLLIGLAIVLVLFGAKRLPELASSLGKSMREFKKATTEADSHLTPSSPTTPTRTCASCKTALEPDWTHCPRCGMASTPPSSATSQP